MVKNLTNVSFREVEFDLMADGDILVTLSWPGEGAMLSRSAIIHTGKVDDKFNDLRDLLLSAISNQEAQLQ